MSSILHIEYADMMLFHNTDTPFLVFEPRPCFFSETLEENVGYFTDHPGSTIMVARPGADVILNIGTIEDTDRFAKEMLGADAHLYSMFDVRIGEYAPDVVNGLIDRMMGAGFHGTRLTDYKPGCHGEDCTSIVVFRPDLTLLVKYEITEIPQ